MAPSSIDALESGNMSSAVLHGRMEDRSVSMLRANVSSAPIAIFVAAVGDWAYKTLWGGGVVKAVFDIPVLQLIPILLVLTVVHEAVHALTWKALSAHHRETHVRFGINWRYLAPYAHPVGRLPAWINLAGGLAPALLLGIGPFVWATSNSEPLVAGIALLMVAGSAGDFMIAWQLIGVPMRTPVEDRPDRVGVIIHWDATHRATR
ncbi:DUF3267 domain-containing protein [Niveibacterium sp. 24ML]|uniref:DUF3267 domain-containing protein n=1 Tax=Niveibacterium sp. 24ML TaxID=2985512 RepID=UPI00226ED11D|nr:DUF3267 domain-containing protein [Niveibacterium sp. 24ML]MCX9154985.1 DUF3267 domain-containing protein [Niveibacterium sp. 24ML]